MARRPGGGRRSRWHFTGWKSAWPSSRTATPSCIATCPSRTARWRRASRSGSAFSTTRGSPRAPWWRSVATTRRGSARSFSPRPSAAAWWSPCRSARTCGGTWMRRGPTHSSTSPTWTGWSFEPLSPGMPPPVLTRLRDRAAPGLVVFSSGTTGHGKAALFDLDELLKRYRTARPGYRGARVPPAGPPRRHSHDAAHAGARRHARDQ